MQWETFDEEQAKRVARINVIKRGKIANTNEKRAIVNISNSSNYTEFHASLEICIWWMRANVVFFNT